MYSEIGNVRCLCGYWAIKLQIIRIKDKLMNLIPFKIFQHWPFPLNNNSMLIHSLHQEGRRMGIVLETTNKIDGHFLWLSTIVFHKIFHTNDF